MTTLGDLISDVENYLYSYGMQRDKVTTLVSDITDTSLTLQVSEGRLIDRGFLEIGQELMAVQSADGSSGTVTIHPWGRAQRGTTAVAHPSGSRVVASPRFPRSSIARQVNRTIHSVFPDLYRVKTDESQVASGGRVTYALPADVSTLISVSYELPGPSREWQRLYRYRTNFEANPENFPTGKSLDIYEGVLPGRPIRVAYRASFGTFLDETDTLDSLGMQDRWADLLVYGTCGNLVLAMEPLRLQSDAVETQERAEGVQPSQATTVARQLLGMFKQRIMEERQLLQRSHPPVMTRQY